MLSLINGKYVVSEAQTVDIPEIVIPYQEKVVTLIREKYSLDEELAIQRQRDTKPDEFNVYFKYCEDCKKRAKAL